MSFKDTRPGILGAARAERGRVGLMRVLLLLPAALLAGCLGSPERSYEQAPIEAPADFAAARGTSPESQPANERWWASLGDEALAAAIEQAFEHNRDLHVAAARVEEALAEARIAGARRSPSAQLAGEAGRQRQNFIGLPLPGGDDVLSSTATTFGLALHASWEPDLWGRLSAGERAAAADAAAELEDLFAAHLSLAGQVAKAWFALAEARLQGELVQSTVGSYRTQVELLHERHLLGRAEALDLHLFENQLASAEAALELHREQEARALRRLELLLGRAPRGTEPGSAHLPRIAGPIPAGLPADLAWRRPDLVAAARRLEALDWRLSAARAELLPALRLTGSLGRRSSELSDLFDSDFDVWSLAANLVQPLFEGGRLRAQVERADARARAALEQLAQDFLRALFEVESALAAEEHLARREEHLERAAREAASARVLAEERYFRGLVDVLFLLDAQRRDLLGQGELLTLRRARLETRIDLFLALGGDFGAATPPRLEPHLVRHEPDPTPLR